MKKFVLLLIGLFTFSIVSAQGISIGAKAGVNYAATVTSDDGWNDNFNAILGPHFGVVADIALTDDFSVQPELLYSPSGSNLVDDPTGGDTEYDVTTKVNYFMIPIMAKYYFVDGFSLEAGPYLGFVMSVKQSGTAGGIDWIEAENLKEHYNSIDYGLGVGASYALEMGVFFTARYNMGLSNIMNPDREGIFPEPTDGFLDKDDQIQNNIFQFSVGYKFM